MRRKFIFRGGSKELVFPVTPESFQVETGRNMELVNIHALGDVVVSGYGTLATLHIACMFPSESSPLGRGDAPRVYISQLEKWAKQASKLRFIVGNTGVNLPVLLESVSWGEQDGSNDVYAKLILREYRTPKLLRKANTAVKETVREQPSKVSSGSVSTYTAKYGDTLCSICRKYYGNDSPATYNKLAAYNGKSNPNLLMTGEVLKIPQPL